MAKQTKSSSKKRAKTSTAKAKKIGGDQIKDKLLNSARGGAAIPRIRR
jgi:hypothetical protein